MTNETNATLESPDGVLFGPDELAASTLRGALVTITRRELAAMARPWAELGQEQQTFTLERISRDYAPAIAAAVEIIATADRAHILAEVESVTFKDGIKAVLKIGGATPQRHMLADAAGCRVFVVVCPPNAVIDNPDPAATKGDPNQQSLPLIDAAEQAGADARVDVVADAAAEVAPAEPPP